MVFTKQSVVSAFICSVFLMTKPTERKSVKGIGYGIIALFFVAISYFSDKILLIVFAKNREIYKDEHPLYSAIYKTSGNKAKTLDLTKANYGPYLTEGSFTDEAEFNSLSSRQLWRWFYRKNKWLGLYHMDYWRFLGPETQRNEIHNRTLQSNLNDSYSQNTHYCQCKLVSTAYAHGL